MTKWVVEYGTGEYDDYMFHTVPLYYDGSREQLNQEFEKIGYKMLAKQNFHKTLERFGLAKTSLYGIRFQLKIIKVGSNWFEAEHFLTDRWSSRDQSIEELYKAYSPEIYTLDEWFERGVKQHEQKS